MHSSSAAPAVLPSPAAALAEDSGSDDYVLSVKDESSDADEYEDWDSDAEGGLSAVCLFCDAAGPVPRTVSHLATAHGFVAGEWLRAAAASTPASAATITGDYGSVRLVNYIRARVAAGVSSPASLREEVFAGANGIWEDESHLLPRLEGDALLFALNGDDDDDDDSEGAPVGGAAASAGAGAGAVAGSAGADVPTTGDGGGASSGGPALGPA